MGDEDELIVHSEGLGECDASKEMTKRLQESGWLGVEGHVTDLASCLPVLLEQLEWQGNIRHVCEALPYASDRPFNIVDFRNTMANLGYSSRSVSIELRDIDERLMPCLFLPQDYDGIDKHAMVPLRYTDEGDHPDLFVFSGDIQEVSMLPPEFDLKGIAYFFDKMDVAEMEFEKQTLAASGFGWFRTLFGRFKNIFYQIIFASIAINVLALAMPIFVMIVYDRVIGAHSQHTLDYLVAGTLIALLTEVALRSIRARCVCWIGARLDNIVSNAIFEQLLYLPARFTEGAPISSQVARIKAFEIVRDFFTNPLFIVVIEAPFTLILIGAIVVISGPLAFIPLVIGLFYILMLLVARPKLRVAIRASAKAGSAKQQFNMETFNKMQALRYNGISQTWFDTFRELSGKASLTQFRALLLTSTIETMAHSLSILAGVCTIAFGVYLVWNEQITIGAMIATMIIIWRVLAPLQTLCSMLPRMEHVTNSVAQIDRLIQIEPERTPRVSKGVIDSMEGRISISNVGLRYGKKLDPVIVGLSVDAEPGQLVAITGSNGAGKSTVLKLINGLYKPQAGYVRIDGVDIRQMDPIELRRYIPYVSQEPDFFEGTIAENLRFADPVASDATLRKALEKVHAWEDVVHLKDGLNTKIGGNHLQLPMGLAYGINLARAFIRESNIMLFDELPYSILNSESGDFYRDIIESYKGKRTIFYVTHREDYLKIADKVLVLQVNQRPKIYSPEEVMDLYLEI